MLDTLIDFTTQRVTEVDADVWGVQPTVASRMLADPAQLLGKDDLEQLLNRGEPNPLVATVVLDHKVVPREKVTTRAALEAFRTQGATITFAALQRKLPVIRDLCQELMRRTNVPSFGVAYLTPPDNQGFDIHWDLGSVTVIQIAGTKTWVLRRPVINTEQELAIPWSARGFREGETDGEPFMTATLEPGDVLFIPRAWVHFARATNKESLHVSIGALHKGIDLESCYTVYP